MEETVQAQNADVAAQPEQNHEAVKTPQESFAELRRAKDELEKQAMQLKLEKDWYEKQLNLQAQQKQQPQVPVEEDFDYRQLESEEFPDGKKLVKALNTFNKKLSSYEQKLAEKDQKIQILETAQEFPDFKEIVTAENIEKYIKSDEDMREAVETAKNPLRKVYNLIKKSAAYQADKASQVAKSKPISQEEKRVQEKEAAPRVTSVGVRSSAISSAAQATSNSRMTRQQREALWAETQALARK